jgi:hypothetical protein
MKPNALAQNPPMVSTEITIIDARLLNLCRQIKFGEIRIKVAHGQAVEVIESHKSHRLDLTDGADVRTVKVDKPNLP